MEEFEKVKQYAITFGKDDKFTIKYSKVRLTEYIKKLFIVLESWKFEPNHDMNLFLSDTEEEEKISILVAHWRQLIECYQNRRGCFVRN